MGTAMLQDKAVEDVGGEIGKAGWQRPCRMRGSQSNGGRRAHHYAVYPGVGYLSKDYNSYTLALG
ncbi:hypothetical protein I79_003971 [Cricetulus griseus]|uniref:Uncharacterized protein n=1 Tax=Cricetulus griseus TaxID=10029 RepID=G3H1E6_CRIGR|nr:hypothetical protein I79_003971 [Cricetulus griseus]